MGTPIPRKSSEIAGSYSTECKVYHLTPEQIANLDPAKPIPKSHKKPTFFIKQEQRGDRSKK
ncbi:hypothetical protein QE450_000822 [Paenibacillus sp. SORGH_AS306]|nr:hypothetical protein [Paenibacillus sp. SORGH_AS_0306]MDR6110365.1 hypothetical protein [Paenibacillus sp. SORGH_AS_0338]